MSVPLPYRYEGEGEFRALPRFTHLCDREFVIGETYRMEAREERSAQSHSHYFAALHDAWANLPEQYAERFPTAEHLRKYALIKTNYHDERSIVCTSKAEAQRIASFIRPMGDFAIVAVSEAVVTVYTAKSQSMKAMGKKVFQESKQAVLDLVAEMIGVEPAQLVARATEAAGGPLEADAAQPAPDQPEPEKPVPEPDAPIDERLRAVAFELGFAGGINEVERRWKELKETPELKALHQRAPEVLRELIAAAREKARGNLSEGQFKRMVESIAEKAAPRSEAA